MRVLTERVVDESVPRLTWRCSPYHTHSALYLVIDHRKRRLQFRREDCPEERR